MTVVAADKKHWEKKRRDCLAKAFTNLEKLLPSYDPSSTETRINVLLKSIEYIQELQNKIQELLKPNLKINAEVLQLKKLQDRIKRLVSRNELLSNLLREAKIPIPNKGGTTKNFKYIHKWSGRINEKTALALQKKEESMKENLKENNSDETMRTSPKNQSKIRKKSNSSGSISKNNKNTAKKGQIKTNQIGTLIPVQPVTTNCVIIYTQACNTQSCYLVTNAPSNNCSNSSQTVITSSALTANPVMSTNIKGSKKAIADQTCKLSNLGTGTLILASGTLYPVLPQCQPLLPTRMLLQVTDNGNNPNRENQITQVASTSKVSISNTINVTSPPTNTKTKTSNLPHLLCKPSSFSSLSGNMPWVSRCLTKTTQMNKVPIPASSSSTKFIVPECTQLPTKRKNITKGKRIGRTKLCRKAFRNIRKMIKKRELEAKEEISKRMKIENQTAEGIQTNGGKLGSDIESQTGTTSESSIITNYMESQTTIIEKDNLPENLNHESKEDIDKSGLNQNVSIISNDIVVESARQNIPTVDSSKNADPPVVNSCEGEKNLRNDPSQKELSLTPIQECRSDKLDSNTVINKVENLLNDESTKNENLDNLKSSSSEIIQNNHSLSEKTGEIDRSKSEEKNSKTSNEGTNAADNMEASENNIEIENICSINQNIKNLDLQLGHSDLSNDLFASLQVPTGCQNPESTSPTAAFLLAFPLVSSLTGVKVTEVMEDDNPDSQRETPTLLQIGAIDSTKTSASDNFAPNLLNMDFFSTKDIYSGFYNSFEQHLNSLTSSANSFLNDITKNNDLNKVTEKGSNPSTNIDNCNVNNRQLTCKPQESGIVHDFNVKTSQIYPHKLPSDIHAKVNIQNEPQKAITLNGVHDGNRQNKVVEDKQKNEGLFSMNPPVTKKSDQKCVDSQGSLQKNIGGQNSYNSFSVQKNSTSSVSAPSNQKIFHTHTQTSKVQNSLEQQQNVLPRNLNKQSTELQPLFQYNTHGPQIPLGENRNFVPITSHSNFGHNLFSFDNTVPTFTHKNLDYKNLNYAPKDTPQNSYFTLDNKAPDNSKNVHGGSRTNTSSQKNIHYNHSNLTSKKDGNFNNNINLDNKVINAQKPSEPKETPSNCGMVYNNITYDLNTTPKVCTSVQNTNKTFTDPLYANSNNTYNYYGNNETYTAEHSYKSVKNDRNLHTNMEFEIYLDYKKTDVGNTYYPENYKKNHLLPNKSENLQEKPTFNWMTSSKNSSDPVMPSFTKEEISYSNHNIMSNNQSTFFNSSSMYSNENLGQTAKKSFDIQLTNINMNYQKNDIEENQFNWSPTKMPQYLDPVPNFVTSTLPTLVGDLALGTANFTEQKLEFGLKNNKDSKCKTVAKFNYENQSFLSVSQLVHQSDKAVPAKTTKRRNSGNGSKNNSSKTNKRAVKTNEESKELQQFFNKPPTNQNASKSEIKTFNYSQTNNAAFFDPNKRNSLKVTSSNYSAEALIGHTEGVPKRDQVFSGVTMKNIPVPPYIPDNILPYYPPVDLQQENYMQQNQNYQNFPHNFTTFPSSTYGSNTFIPSSTITTPYLTTSSFMSDLGNGHEFSTTTDNMNIFPSSGINKDNKFKNGSKSNSNRNDKDIQSNQCSNNVSKKAKIKPSNEANISTSVVDFSFLSVPGSINSPLLPDDFHSHGSFFPPPPTQSQLYHCKNSLYPSKQSTITSSASLLPLPPIPSISKSIQHPQISPSLNSGGTSLTNFNLSTIFPEINKSSINEVYTENRPKESSTSQYPSNSVPQNSKPIFTYPNCQSSQVYGIDSR